MTPVQMFRDRWECSHIGTVIFAVQAILLVPYIIIGVMGGGAGPRCPALVPCWAGGALVALVVMSYVFFGGMRGTAWVNTLQTLMFLAFGLLAVAVVGVGMGGFGHVFSEMLDTPGQAALLTRERVSPWYFFSYTFIPLSSIAFPTSASSDGEEALALQADGARSRCWRSGCRASSSASPPIAPPLAIKAKLDAQATIAAAGRRSPRRARSPATPRRRQRDDRLVEHYAPVWLIGLLGASVMAR